MNIKMLIGNAWVEVDVSATEEWYKNAPEWNCACEGCRRFIELAKGKHLPDSALKTLQELSIPPEKATYVCLLDGADLYEFCYRIIGRIIETSSERAGNQDPCICESEHICPYFDFPSPHFDIVFYMHLPVLSE